MITKIVKKGSDPISIERQKLDPTPFLILLMLAACGSGEDGNGPRPEPVVVYAAYEDLNYLPDLFLGFTEETGIYVTVRNRDAQTIVNEVINDEGSPPADVLLTRSVHGAWRAADEGALRPVIGEEIARHVPMNMRDPDHQWVGVSARVAVLAYDERIVEPSTLESYAALGTEAWAGRLCLSSSALPENQTLIAMLIDDLGARPAELAVRYWARNLTLPPFESQLDLLAAIESGTCAAGIAWLPQAKLGETGPGPVKYFLPPAAVVDIEAMGVARHARQPETALALIEWFVEHAEHVGQIRDVDISVLRPRELAVAGWRGAEALKLAERASYR